MIFFLYCTENLELQGIENEAIGQPKIKAWKNVLFWDTGKLVTNFEK